MGQGSAVSGTTAAYVPGFQEDVFISYGHIDNAPAEPWVEQLHARLEERLPQILGENIRIWRDRKLNGAEALWDVLEKRISSSALFLSVLSPRYVKSPACKQEAGWFSECARKSGKPKVADMSRILRVLKTPYNVSDEPPGFKETETLGFPFFEFDAQDKTSFEEFPADKDVDLEGYRKFHKQSENLAQTTAKLLFAMREAFKPEAPPAAAKTVFVSYVTADKAKDRVTVVNALSGKGYSVVPTEPMPLSAPELDELMDRELAGCSLAVHLMGARYGLVPEESKDGHSVVQLQYAKVREQATVRQLIWIPEDLTNVEKSQADFLATVENSGDAKCEVFKTAFWPFLNGLTDELAKPPAKPKLDHAKSVFLLCDQADLDRPLRKALRSYLIGQGFPVVEPAFQGDVKLLRELEADNMTDSEATLIYYGTATDAWVQMKRRTLLKVLGTSDTGRKHVRGLYLCSPEDEYKRGHYMEFSGKALPEGGGFCPLLVMGDCQPFAPEKLMPFIQHLERDEEC